MKDPEPGKGCKGKRTDDRPRYRFTRQIGNFVPWVLPRISLTALGLGHIIRTLAEIAQSVEQRTENPRVPSSTLGLGT